MPCSRSDNEYKQLGKSCDETQANSPVKIDFGEFYPDMKRQILESDNRISPDIKLSITDIACSGTCGFIIVNEFERDENGVKKFNTNNYLFSWGSGPCLGLGPEVSSTEKPMLIDNVFLGKINEEKFGHSWIMEVNCGLVWNE